MKDATTNFPNPTGGLLLSVPTYGSSNSLDISAYLDACPHSNLGEILSTSKLSLSFSETTASLEDDLLRLCTPPPPCAPKYLTTPVLSTSDRTETSNSSKSDILISIPTSPRVRTMIMEPICVSQWTVSFPKCHTQLCRELKVSETLIQENLVDEVPPSHTPWEGYANSEDKVINPPWVPEGSILPPDAFNAILRNRRGQSTGSGPLIKKRSDRKTSKGSVEDRHKPQSTPIARLSCSMTTKSSLLIPTSDSNMTRFPLSLPHDTVPTITISNSVAIFPLSSESSHSLEKCAPLAVRRGQDLPKPLQVGSDTSQSSDMHVSGSYPGIPSPFLGTHTPTFDYSFATETTSVDLNVMCENLRSRIPPLRIDKLSARTNLLEAVETSSQVSEEDEWAFAQGLETSFGLDPSDLTVKTEVGKPSIPAQKPSANAAIHADISIWSAERTLTNVETPTQPALPAVPASNTRACRTSQPDAQKLQRRRTVIIETPDDGPRRRTRVTLDLSHLADCGESTEDNAIPLESDALDNLSFSLDDFAHSTPSRRPPSSATLRPPAKGILKEKKSVRFSVLPSMHEYSIEKPTNVQEEKKATSPPSKAPTSLSRRLSLAPKSSLRQGSPPRQHIIMESAVKDHRISFPKHPMVKSLTKSFPSRGKGDSSATVPANKVSNTSGVPNRSPLRAVNGRTSLPTSIPGNKKLPPPKKSAVKEAAGEAKKLRPTGTVSMPPRPRHITVQDENKARRESKAGAQKSRHESVPVVPKSRAPFRSMLARLSSKAV
ncbi:hypothetical protein QCA50_010502 [Cerrena zonata]|uniref:Uncharacterized protein n=1 Tax=Cerrena zonata TaxID=2478898 RepID=A0AAW0FYY2_9APHY